MTNDEIKILILRRLYSGAFEDGVDYRFSLHEFADQNGIDRDLIWKIFDELKDAGLIKCELMGGIVEPTTPGLLYCEENGLIDPELKHKQAMIRTKLVVALYDIQEKSPHGTLIDWEYWIREAGVNNRDFDNNRKILLDTGLIDKKTHRSYFVAPFGITKVKEYKAKVKRVEEFGRLDKLVGVTPQQRGHKLEDLIGEIIGTEGWEVDTRVSAQGQENDIIIHKGLDYFFISCKWEKSPIQPEELDLMYSRASGRKDVKGSIIVSMSGFTDNCVNQAIRKMENCHLILFGKLDIEKIFGHEKTFTSLLEEKYKAAMIHGRILLDGEIRDVKPV